MTVREHLAREDCCHTDPKITLLCLAVLALIVLLLFVVR